AEHKARLAEAHGVEAEAQHDVNQAEREAAQARARADAAEDAHAREHAREQRARDEAAEAREERTEAREERGERARAAGDERPAPRGTRKSSAALQGLATFADVREEPRGVVITLSGELLFPTGEKLSPIGQRNLDRVAQALAEQPKDSKFLVEGHTDNSGDAKTNKQLSAQRAKAVAEQLKQSGIDGDRIEVENYGETRPIAGNDTPEGRAANRRVEIVIERPVKTASRG
ncbi:MAG TPA: OmpA family protein, partial [Polyangiales bacterium]